MSAYVRGERCGYENCPSRRFTVDGRGHEICDRGHDQGVARGGAQDEDEFLGASQGRTTRRKETEQAEKVHTRMLDPLTVDYILDANMAFRFPRKGGF
jgi:hypothetical protein